MTNKVYLGDALYAEVEDGMVKLTTGDGNRATNTIFLEPRVCQALFRYVYEISFMEAIKETATNLIVDGQKLVIQAERAEVERLKRLLEKAGIHDY